MGKVNGTMRNVSFQLKIRPYTFVPIVKRNCVLSINNSSQQKPQKVQPTKIEEEVMNVIFDFQIWIPNLHIHIYSIIFLSPYVSTFSFCTFFFTYPSFLFIFYLYTKNTQDPDVFSPVTYPDSSTLYKILVLTYFVYTLILYIF